MILLLVAALAEPFPASDALTARRVLLVIDNSARMNAADVEPTRLAAAKEEGRKVIRGFRFQDEMAIVVAGTQPRVVYGLTGHQRALRDALDAISGTDGPTQLAEAVALARRLAAAGSIDGEKTKLNGKRNELQLTGTPGTEGPSDVETTAIPEAREQAARQYREKVEKFKKEMEAALEHEPLPLTHRSMIKRYFEMIRPSAGDAMEKKDEPDKAEPAPSGK